MSKAKQIRIFFSAGQSVCSAIGAYVWRVTFAKGLVPLLAALTLSACQANGPAHNADFIAGLGGQAGIARFVDAYIEEVAQDTILYRYYQNTDLVRFKAQQVAFYCRLLRANCTPLSEPAAVQSLRAIHAGMNISQADFEHALKAMSRAMEKAGWPLAQRNHVFASLLQARPMLVTH